MPLINSIPERYEDGFREINKLDDAEFEKIEKILNNAPLVSSINKLASIVASNDDMKFIEIEDILMSIGSLISFIDKEEIVNEIIDDIVSISEFSEIIMPKNKATYEKRLFFLINNKQIYYASKADDLITNYGNTYIQSKIVSDIRPVFDIKVEEAPSAGIILHNLNIHYQSNEEPFHKDISLVLNSDDLQSLKDVLERAEKKELVLQGIFERSGLKNLNN